MAHRLSMEEREKLFLTGVVDVISFDEEVVIAETEKGTLILKGTNLNVSKLNVENGELEIGGYIYSINYEEGNYLKEKSLLGKIFK